MFVHVLALMVSALSDVLCVYYVRNGLIPSNSVMTTFLHVNLINCASFFLMYFFLKARHKLNFNIVNTFCNKQELLRAILYAIPVIAAFYRLYMMETIKITNISISGMIKPLLGWLLAVILLKERFKLQNIIYVLISLLGFFIANYTKLGCDNVWVLLFYVLLASYGDVTTRHYCRTRKDPVEAIGVEFIWFTIYSIVILTWKETFNIDILFSKYTLIISLLAFLFRVLLVHAIRKASSVVAIEIMNYSKIVFTIIFSFLLLNDIPSVYKVVGALIIALSVILFRRQEVKDNIHVKN